MSLAEAGKPVVAAFDFDGTLTRRDTLLPFLRETAGVATWLRNLLSLLPMLLTYALGMIANDVAKQRLLARFFAGMRMDQLQAEAERFAVQTVPKLIRPAALRRLAWHQQQGHRCVVISASLDIYVRPWALQAGFEEVIASHLEVLADGRVTGKLSGGNCFAAEKVQRFRALFPDRDNYTLYAYGDSRGDRELLADADFAFYRHMPD